MFIQALREAATAAPTPTDQSRRARCRPRSPTSSTRSWRPSTRASMTRWYVSHAGFRRSMEPLQAPNVPLGDRKSAVNRRCTCPRWPTARSGASRTTCRPRSRRASTATTSTRALRDSRKSRASTSPRRTRTARTSPPTPPTRTRRPSPWPRP